MSTYGVGLFENHQRLLRESAISPEVAAARGYRSVDTKSALESIGIVKTGRSVPGLLIPIYAADGTVASFQYRPDNPRVDPKGKPVKYETPWRSSIRVDVPPTVRDHMADATVPLWITEGMRKADAAVTAGLTCIALMGVDCWQSKGVALPDWNDIRLRDRVVYVAFDSDVMTKDSVAKALHKFAAWLEYRGATVRPVILPATGDDKVGLDDYFAAGGTVEHLHTYARDVVDLLGQPELPDAESEPEPPPPTKPVKLAAARATFMKWLHIDDDAPMLATAATVVANNAEGDPAWLLLVGPPSSGKTETLQAAAGLPYIHAAANVTESSLLSGVSRKERDVDATGGLLRLVGDYGIILCKDFTSVLSQNKDVSAAALAALREVYDGSWDRPVGAGGGRILSWSGKCGLIGGVTPSIDRYGQVVGALGDRYLLLRLPDVNPESMAESALDQGSRQRQMREELAQAMTGLIAGADLSRVTRELTRAEKNELIELATFTARARTTVERNGYTREVEVLPQPEGTGRIVGQMRRLLGGLEAIGCDEATAWRVLYRVAIDCVPRLRTRVMEVLLNAETYTVGFGGMHNPDQLTTGKVAEAVGIDWKTANRHLEDLRLLDLAELEVEEKSNAGEKPVYWHRASKWLRKHWPTPRSEGLDEKYTQTIKDHSSNGVSHSPTTDDGSDGGFPGSRSFRPDPQTWPKLDNQDKPKPDHRWADALFDRE